MAGKRSGKKLREKQLPAGFPKLTVAGFKSISQEQSLEIRPLTILAGANSSGKSSMMQPLLLLKQTLESPFNPGALLLNGPNVRFTSTDQLLSRIRGKRSIKDFQVGIETDEGLGISTYFTRAKNKGFEVEQTIYKSSNASFRFYRGMSQSELLKIIDNNSDTAMEISEITTFEQERFLLSPFAPGFDPSYFDLKMPGKDFVEHFVQQVIHLPGWRGNPERTYPVTAVGPTFPGTFEPYVASIISQWQVDGKLDKLVIVNRDLERLGLTSGVSARVINDTQIELLVNRFSRSGEHKTDDSVSIADVGLGVSQTLPVIVALHTAKIGQLVYLEQPEIHLHPRAQSAMAEVLADAAMQGAQLVVETHSSLLLLGIQTLVAEGKLPPELVKLYWFKLLDDGSSQIISADLDETGAFGDWPEDFAAVTLASEDRYLDAIQARVKED